jgi:lipoprotein-releasing system permease protein
MAANRDPNVDRRVRRGLGYKSFVAWRYLLVNETKVTRSTKILLVLGAGLLAAIGLVLELTGQVPAKGSPIRVVQESTALFVGIVIFLGVLRHSKPAVITFLIGLAVLIAGGVGLRLLGVDDRPLEMLDNGHATALQICNGAAIAGGVIAGLAMFFGFLRAFFTFFTTVPIGGVWIGTAALVMVLAVMSGFESDLREKILGSNAHLQITREDGDFVEWREVKAKIDRMPGVVASTPYAVSEVVVAANNTGMPVIIKGIDPRTVGKVTDLVSDIEDPLTAQKHDEPTAAQLETMKRLDPITTDAHDLRVPQHPRTGPVIDPPPPDMPTPGDPIDFSIAEPAAGSANGSAWGNKAAGSGSAAGRDPAAGKAKAKENAIEPPQPFGGDAPEVLGDDKGLDRLAHVLDTPAGGSDHHAAKPVIDPPPPDLITSNQAPTDYSHPDDPDSIIKVIDVPFDAPSLSRRTQSLPGVLVGRELVKQTHLYTGEEVRVVSPLSDPSNPDATGTPIPFNRDYRVAGIFYTGMYEYDLKYVYVTLDSLQDFLDRGDAVDGIEVRVTNPDETYAFIAQFQAAFGPGYRVQDWKELNRSLFSALKLEKVAMFLVLGIVILVASFSIVGNLIMVVVEKAREIALLKTLGASDIGVMQLFAIQGLMIGLIGTALGIGTGLLGCWAGKRFGLPLNPDVYYIDRLPIHVDPASVLAAASAGILISIAATLYPAVVAARVRPAAGMRH